MISTKDAATALGAPYRTVAMWAREGRLPGAKLVATPRGPVWEIPAAALKVFERPPRGRPKKARKKRSAA